MKSPCSHQRRAQTSSNIGGSLRITTLNILFNCRHGSQRFVSLSYALSLKTFDGRLVFLSQERWRHTQIRHPEVGNNVAVLSKALSDPDEAYENGRRGIHSLFQIHDGRFIVVIYEPKNHEGFVRTAYITNLKRKERRYRGLQSLRQS